MSSLKHFFPIGTLLSFLVCFAGVGGVSFDEDLTITLEQKVAIDKLRNRILPHIVEKYMEETIYLVRWLRSTNFDISRAEKKLLENIRWRKENKMATIENEDFSDVAEDYPYSNDGYDKDGRPVLIAFAGDWDIRKAVVTGKINRVLSYVDKGMEILARKIRKLQSQGKNVTQAVLIVELSLFRVVEFLHSYESHFPGMADKVLFVNAPPAVHFVIEMIRQNVSKESRDAIRVYGTNEEQWKKMLLKYIDERYLPVELGGTLERN